MPKPKGVSVELTEASKESHNLARLFIRANDAVGQRLAEEASASLLRTEAALAQYYGAEHTLTSYLDQRAK